MTRAEVDLKTVQLTELEGLSTTDRLDLIGLTVRIDIKDEDNVGTVFGTLQLLTFVEDGVLIGLAGAQTPIPVSAEELPNVSFTFEDWGF